MKELDLNTRWFVDNYHTIAGRPKMEDALVDYAREHYLYRIVWQGDLQKLVTELNEQQLNLHAQNKRLQIVDVTLSANSMYNDLQYLGIGQQHFTLRRVRGDYKRYRTKQ